MVVNAKVGVGYCLHKLFGYHYLLSNVILSVGEIDTVPEIGEGVLVQPKLFPIN